MCALGYTVETLHVERSRGFKLRGHKLFTPGTLNLHFFPLQKIFVPYELRKKRTASARGMQMSSNVCVYV